MLRSRRPADLDEYHMLISYTTTVLVEGRRKRSSPFRLVLVTLKSKCACTCTSIKTLDSRGTTYRVLPEVSFLLDL